jgi:hypothetical protein
MRPIPLYCFKMLTWYWFEGGLVVEKNRLGRGERVVQAEPKLVNYTGVGYYLKEGSDVEGDLVAKT